MALLQNGDDPPLGAYEAPLHNQQPQNTVDPALDGGNTCPASFDPPLEGGNPVPSTTDPPTQSGNALPSTEFLTFPKCGHAIAADLYRDFLTKRTKRDSDCPACQQGPFQVVMKFSSCEHIIVGDPLRGVFKTRTDQCPVCKPLSSGAAATDAHSNPTSPTPAIVHTERSRVTLNKYQDPFTFEGVPVKTEVYPGKDGQARLRVDNEVWKSWSKKQRDRFVYCTNIRFGSAVGEHQPAPTNPGNPNHPEYKPTSTASVTRRNLKRKPDPEKMAAAIRKLLATPDEDVLAGKSPLRQFNGGDA